MHTECKARPWPFPLDFLYSVDCATSKEASLLPWSPWLQPVQTIGDSVVAAGDHRTRSGRARGNAPLRPRREATGGGRSGDGHLARNNPTPPPIRAKEAAHVDHRGAGPLVRGRRARVHKPKTRTGPRATRSAKWPPRSAGSSTAGRNDRASAHRAASGPPPQSRLTSRSRSVPDGTSIHEAHAS